MGSCCLQEFLPFGCYIGTTYGGSNRICQNVRPKQGGFARNRLLWVDVREENTGMSKILIVDDALFMRKVIRDLLVANDYTDLIEASSGQEAVNMYNEHRPDLIIMDITMPELDGIETIRVLRKIETNINILMCSAMGQEALVHEALKLGARDFIVKPFKPDRMLQAVRKLLS